jgi:peroxiredoxin Q/BCP
MKHISTIAASAFLAVAVLFSGTAKGQAAPVKVGNSVPVFTLTDQNGKPFSVNDYVGKKILVIYFYPKDESSVCTKEACAFRDNYTQFTDKGALVIGINGGTVESHHSFAANHQLPFVLLSDPGNKVLKQFGVKGGAFGLTGRQTYVIDLTGKVVFSYNSMMQGRKHEEDALAYIGKLQPTK